MALPSRALPLMAEPVTVDPPRWPTVWPAIVVTVALILVLLFYELWANPHGYPRISQWTQDAKNWIKWVGVGLLGLLGWHLFRGGPLSRKET